MKNETELSAAPLQKLLNPMPVSPSRKSSITGLKNKKAWRKSRAKAHSLNYALEKQINKYVVASDHANAFTGLSVERIWRGDSVEAQKELCKLLCSTMSRCRVNAANKPADLQKRILKLCLVHVCGSECLALLDTGAVPNIISNILLNRLGINAKTTKITITVASAANTKYTALIHDIHVMFGEVTTHMKLLVIERVQVDKLIGVTKLEQLKASVDLGDQFLDLKVGEKTLQVGLRPESEHLLDNNESTEDEDFTTKPSYGRECSFNESDGRDTMVVIPAFQQE